VLAFYLAALIFGLGLFAVQMLASGDAGQHGAPGLPEPGGNPTSGLSGADGHPAVAPVVDGHFVDGHGVDGPFVDGHAGHAQPGLHAWVGIFTSLRFYMFAAIGLGVVGAPVTAFGMSSPGLTLAVALLTAFGVGTLASLGFRILGRETLSSGATQEELVGHVGRVLVACEKGRRGKVRLTVRGQTLDFVATTDEARIEPAMAVIVESVLEGRVHVCAAPSELLPE
jgi:hypothetical protein